jgi:PIN domain nuclease of toxin-antitoxin system
MNVVLDAWAVMAMLKAEPAADRVRSIVDAHESHVCSVNLGEAYHSLIRSHGPRIARERIDKLRQLMHVQDPAWPLARDAAEIKARGGLSYADAFCVATARWWKAPLYTGDPEIVRLDGDDLDVVDLRRGP